MRKIIIFLSLLISVASFADDTVKVTVGTQTYLCEITNQLNCKATNKIQKTEIFVKKNAGQINIQDKERKLDGEIATSLDHGNVVYDLTLCSPDSCGLSTVTTDSNGSINQVVSGQYNITQKSFYVLGFFISTHASDINLEEKILTNISHLSFHSR
jgi:hypothetical protein